MRHIFMAMHEFVDSLEEACGEYLLGSDEPFGREGPQGPLEFHLLNSGLDFRDIGSGHRPNFVRPDQQMSQSLPFIMNTPENIRRIRFLFSNETKTHGQTVCAETQGPRGLENVPRFGYLYKGQKEFWCDGDVLPVTFLDSLFKGHEDMPDLKTLIHKRFCWKQLPSDWGGADSNIYIDKQSWQNNRGEFVEQEHVQSCDVVLPNTPLTWHNEDEILRDVRAEYTKNLMTAHFESSFGAASNPKAPQGACSDETVYIDQRKARLAADVAMFV